MCALQQTDIKARDHRVDTREPDRVKMGEEKALSHKGREKREGDREADRQIEREETKRRGERDRERDRERESGREGKRERE